MTGREKSAIIAIVTGIVILILITISPTIALVVVSIISTVLITYEVYEERKRPRPKLPQKLFDRT
jgi:membrane protein implicated in regulation of membrane protease activity